MRIVKKMAILIPIAILLPALLFAQGNRETNQNTISVRSSDISQTLAQLNTLYQYLRVNALYDLDTDALEENLTRALISALDDEYAEYISPDYSQEVVDSISGSYVGIGVYVSKYDPLFIDWDDRETYMLQITSPFPGGPADKVGLRARDLISHINGEAVYQMDADEASKLLRGEEGVPMTLVVHRGDSSFELTVTPQRVTTPSVRAQMVPGTKYGYIYIPEFTSSTYSLVSEKLTELSGQGMEALILDLRNNQGGTVDAAFIVANFFLDPGETIYTIEFKPESRRSTMRMIASNQTRKYHIPIAILVNGGTASASEILASALQDNGKAVVIGEQTFGKGIIQDVIPFNEGYIRYTSSHYITPNGNNIHEVGITPDIVIEEEPMPTEEIRAYYNFMDEHDEELAAWVEERPDYSTENIEAFAALYEDEVDFDPIYLRIMVRNEYIYNMEWDERPLVDTVYDSVAKAAVDYLDSL